MTVKKLIEELQQLDPELYVATKGYEGGYYFAEISKVSFDLALNIHKEDQWWYGPHERAEKGDESRHTIVKAITI